MSENSKIEWTDHTFNPWTGCTKVSPACDHCYAEGWAKRSGHVEWGPKGERRRTSTAYWKQPHKWNAHLEGTGKRQRVFCASLADVFDNHKSIQDEWRDDLWELIEATPNLDWLLLTKRPQNIPKIIPERWRNGLPEHIWLGTTVENQQEAERRIPHLIDVQAKVRFLSCEPLLGPIKLDRIEGPNKIQVINALTAWSRDPDWRDYSARIHWVIAGGESGNGFRPAEMDWFRYLRDQCKAAGVPFFMKQTWGRTKTQMPPIPDDLMIREFPK